jgi:hypothetical protein
MVPDRYQVLAELPRTGSGKMDRQALTALATPARGAAISRLPPVAAAPMPRRGRMRSAF